MQTASEETCCNAWKRDSWGNTGLEMLTRWVPGSMHRRASMLGTNMGFSIRKAVLTSRARSIGWKSSFPRNWCVVTFVSALKWTWDSSQIAPRWPTSIATCPTRCSIIKPTKHRFMLAPRRLQSWKRGNLQRCFLRSFLCATRGN